MEGLFTVLGCLCCVFFIGVIAIILFSLLRKFVENCLKSDEYTIRDYRDDIDTVLYETKKSGHKIMFRDTECKTYDSYAIHVATRGDEEIIIIDLI